MNPMRLVIVEDEPVARRGLRQLASAHQRMHVVAECRDGNEAVRVIRELTPDLVLLDVQMPGLNGLGVIREIGADAMPLTIFVTAYDTFAVPAFDAAAVDYVVKPIAEDRLRLALDRASMRFDQRRPRYTSRFITRVGRRTVVIPVGEVSRITADGYCAWVYTATARHLLRANLTALERELDPLMFVRVHRSTIVQLSAVRGVERSRSGHLILTMSDGARSVVSRSRRYAVMAALRAP